MLPTPERQAQRIRERQLAAMSRFEPPGLYRILDWASMLEGNPISPITHSVFPLSRRGNHTPRAHRPVPTGLPTHVRSTEGPGCLPRRYPTPYHDAHRHLQAMPSRDVLAIHDVGRYRGLGTRRPLRGTKWRGSTGFPISCLGGTSGLQEQKPTLKPHASQRMPASRCACYTPHSYEATLPPVP